MYEYMCIHIEMQRVARLEDTAVFDLFTQTYISVYDI